MLSASWQIKNYDDVGNLPITWQGTAGSRIAAATLLKDHKADHYSHLCTAIMLRGFAVECLLKAVWAKGGKKLAEDGKYLKVPGERNHKLVPLAKKVGVFVNADESDLLKRLTLFMVSVGRYPIPTHWSLTQIQPAHGGSSGPPTYWQGSSDEATFDALVSKLHAVIDA